MTDRFLDRLSEYIDGELTPEESELVERHVVGCDECARAADDLRAVRDRAGALPGRVPVEDLWRGIEARIHDTGGASAISLEGRRGLRRRIALTVPQLAAAALTLASVSVAGAWWSFHGSGDAGAPPAAAGPATGAVLAADGSTMTSAERYAQAISELEAALFDPDTRLPPETAERVRRALTTIDRAIEDARRALRSAPGDPYLRQHVTDTMRRKAEFLRNAVRLSQS